MMAVSRLHGSNKAPCHCVTSWQQQFFGHGMTLKVKVYEQNKSKSKTDLANGSKSKPDNH